jgi:hypothetical protein
MLRTPRRTSPVPLRTSSAIPAFVDASDLTADRSAAALERRGAGGDADTDEDAAMRRGRWRIRFRGAEE